MELLISCKKCVTNLYMINNLFDLVKNWFITDLNIV